MGGTYTYAAGGISGNYPQFFWGLDQAYAGANSVVWGTPGRTVTGALFSDTLHVSPEMGEAIAGLAGLGTSKEAWKTLFTSSGAAKAGNAGAVGALDDAAKAAANAGKGAGSADDVVSWSVGRQTNPAKNAAQHWEKHAAEFPELRNMSEYIQKANNFVNSPPQGTLTKIRTNGDVVLYEPKTNTLAIKSVDGVPRTMYKPNPSIHGRSSNLEYFYDQ